MIQKTGIDYLPGIFVNRKIGMSGQLNRGEHAQGPAEISHFLAFVQDIPNKLSGNRGLADFFRIGITQVGNGLRGMQIDAAAQIVVEFTFSGRLKNQLSGVES